MLKRLLSRIKGGGLEEEVAVVSQSMVVSGNLAAPQQILIEGRVEGDVTCGTLVQRAGGTVVGNINADRVRVGGTIRGDIVAGAVSLQSTGRVIGDITYDALLMAAGSRVDGRLCRRGDLSEHETRGRVSPYSDLRGGPTNREPQSLPPKIKSGMGGE